MSYLLGYAVAGIMIGAWRVQVFNRLLDRMYPLAAGRGGMDVWPVILSWVFAWPVLLPLDVLLNHWKWKRHKQGHDR